MMILVFCIDVIFFYSVMEIDFSINIHEAAKKGLQVNVEYLIDEGALVDEKDEEGKYCNRINSHFVLC